MIQVTAKTIFIDKGLTKALASIEGAGKTKAEVGYPSPSPAHADSGLNMASLALCMEKGFLNSRTGRHVPARPFMAQTADRAEAQAKVMLAKAAQLIIEGKRTPKQAMEAIGLWYAGQMKTTFDTGTFAPNSDFTVALKGSSKPLIDTGLLRTSIRSKVVGSSKTEEK